MEFSTKRRAQDDLDERRRKFCKYDPFEPHLSSFSIHESSSFHDLVNDLPPMVDNGYSSTIKLLCPAADKENVDPSPVEIQSDAAPRRPFRRTPL